MIEIKDKRKCTACKACYNTCPVEAIAFIEDEEGFGYPKTDQGKCIQCGKCLKSCPMLLLNEERQIRQDEVYPKYYAAQLKERKQLERVSSGGAFQALVQATLQQNGVIYGAVQKDVDEIFHARAEDLERAELFFRSKYLPSDIRDTYRKAKEDLESGKTVLFSGTGCQIAGLKGYLGKEYNNLCTCEVVCHGIPSKKVWKQYRKEKEAEKKRRITALVFRDKSSGWSNNQYAIAYDDGTIEKERSTQNLFHSGYLQGFFYRPSCGTCPFAHLPRVADITLADYWKYNGPLKTDGEDIGISLIVINSEKGDRMLEQAASFLSIEPSKEEDALMSCRHLNHHPKENPKRNDFIQKVFADGYYAAAKAFFPVPTRKQKVKNYLKKTIRVINKLTRKAKQ